MKLDEASLSLLDLPIELDYEIANLAPYNEETKTALAKTCTHFNFFRVDLSIREAGQALKHAASARKKDVWEVEDLKERGQLNKMLDRHPELLLVKSDVMVPGSGLVVKNVTLYEFCLGAAIEVANIVAPYFDKIKGKDIDGAAERDAQYARYKLSIDKAFTQPAYDWSDLLQKIKDAPADVVAALLEAPMLPEDHPFYGSNLYQAILKFRKDWAPGVVDGDHPQMHDVMKTREGDPSKVKEFSVLVSLQEAHEILFNSREWGNSYSAGGNDFNKIRLVWRQVIGFMKRRLTGEDRCKLAQGFRSLQDLGEKFRRTDQYTDTAGNFPDTAKDNIITSSDLGGGFSVDGYFGGGSAVASFPLGRGGRRLWKSYVEQKLQTCRTYAATPTREKVLVLSLLT
jgi:hypothetical protein